MKVWATVVGAMALITSSGVGAQSAEGLLNILKEGARNAPGEAVQQLRSPYIGPVGMYWDHDSEQLQGVQHVRHGITATGRGGAPTCDMELVAMAHSAYRMSEVGRRNCVRNEYNIVERVHGKEASGHSGSSEIEQRFGPVLDARMEKFRGIRRYAARPRIEGNGFVYDSQRGFLDIYVPIPGGFTGPQTTGKDFVPWSQTDQRSVWSPRFAGQYRLRLRMSESDYQALLRQRKVPEDNLVVFTVNRVWTDPGAPSVPLYDLTVERVHVGFVGETLEVDLTNRQASH